MVINKTSKNLHKHVVLFSFLNPQLQLAVNRLLLRVEFLQYFGYGHDQFVSR